LKPGGDSKEAKVNYYFIPDKVSAECELLGPFHREAQ